MDTSRRIRTIRTCLVGALLAVLMLTVGAGSVGAAVPEAVNPNLPVAIGAGAGVNPNTGQVYNGGSAGLSRSTIQNPVYTGTQTNVSAIPSSNPNETSASYQPGGSYVVYADQTRAVTNTDNRGAVVQAHDSNGNAVYQVVLVGPVTQYPPNGTVTGEPNAYIVVGPYTYSNLGDAPGKVIVTIAYP